MRMLNVSLRRNTLLLCLLFTLFACNEPVKKQDLNSDNKQVRNQQDLIYTPANPNAYQPAQQVQHWADSFDDEAIDRHAWDLWKAINALTGQYRTVGSLSVNLPVWETWFDEYEIFHLDTGVKGAVPYHSPRQMTTSQAPVISFNKFSLEFKQWINEKKYWDESTLIKLNKSFQKHNTPLKQRIVDTSGLSSKATMLKPSFWVIKPDQPSPMQYWKGPGMLNVDGTLDPKVPIPQTWTQIVVVDPKGTAKPATPYTLEVKSSTGLEKMTFTDYEIVGLDRFYWVPLSQQDVEFIKAGNVFLMGGISHEEVEAGDIALLVAMHVTTAEFSNWTWQTFWWSPDPLAKAPSDIAPPFDNYDMAAAYYMLDKNGQAPIVQNPYLETPDEGPVFFNRNDLGVKSNCMTCHHAAAYPTLNMDPNIGLMLNGSYFALGDIKGDEAWFQDRVKTIFMWSMVMSNQRQGKLQDALQ